MTIPNERLYCDLATVKAPADVAEKLNKLNWQFIMDEVTDMKLLLCQKNMNDILDGTNAQLEAMGRLTGREIQVWR